jgi:hypothetical protein
MKKGSGKAQRVLFSAARTSEGGIVVRTGWCRSWRKIILTFLYEESPDGTNYRWFSRNSELKEVFPETRLLESIAA